MFTRTLALALLTSAVLSAPAMAECVYPKTPASTPNGSTATEAEMVASKQALDKYQTDVNGYLSCLDTEGKAAVAAAGDNKEQAQQIQVMTNKKHNAALEDLQARAGEFNQQLRAFKNRSKS